MIETVALIAAAVMLTAVVVTVATRKRRQMQRHPAPRLVFADLVGYTALTDQLGDEAGARRAGVRRTICALSRDHGAWQVKSMGDGVMIWAPTPAMPSRWPRARSRRSARGPTCCPCASVSTPVLPSCAAVTGTAVRSTSLPASPRRRRRTRRSSARRLAPPRRKRRRPASARPASCPCAASSARSRRGKSHEPGRHQPGGRPDRA